jgi:hypothetical protein
MEHVVDGLWRLGRVLIGMTIIIGSFPALVIIVMGVTVYVCRFVPLAGRRGHTTDSSTDQEHRS